MTVRQIPKGLADLTLEAYLEKAEAVILHSSESARAAPLARKPKGPLKVGVDLGTAYLVMVVLDEDGTPLAGEWQFAQVSRDGLVVDFIGAVDLLLGMKARLQRRLKRDLEHAASGYPPGVPLMEVRATANVIESCGMDCPELIDEPSAANLILRLQDGAIVDVGGGTTGIAVVKDGKVVYTADEATGGTHFSLVIAGSLGISFEEAEVLKIRPEGQQRLFSVVRPVMEKVGNIASRHISKHPVDNITLVGGASAFKGMGDVVQEYTGIKTVVPQKPLFITPLGMAMFDSNGTS